MKNLKSHVGFVGFELLQPTQCVLRLRFQSVESVIHPAFMYSFI